jgi:glutamine synthetase
VRFSDQLNLARGKYLSESIASIGEVGICKAVYSVTYSRQQINAPGSGFDEGLPDVSLSYDPAEYRYSWHKNTKIAIAA